MGSLCAVISALICFLKNGPFQASFFIIFVFSVQLKVNKCSINFADDWIWTVDLWYWKRSLYQLRHNHCPTNCLKRDTCKQYINQRNGISRARILSTYLEFSCSTFRYASLAHTILLQYFCSIYVTQYADQSVDVNGFCLCFEMGKNCWMLALYIPPLWPRYTAHF